MNYNVKILKYIYVVKIGTPNIYILKWLITNINCVCYVAFVHI